MSFNYGGQSATEIGTPILVPQPANPNTYTLTFQGEYPWRFIIHSNTGQPLWTDMALPDGVGTKTLTLDTTNILIYPTIIGIEIIDGISGMVVNHVRQQVFGGDTFKVVLTYPSKIPVAQGEYIVSVGGMHMLIPLNQLNYYIFAFGEVDILGNDGGGGAPGQGGTLQ
jgi:hypothetical protein